MSDRNTVSYTGDAEGRIWRNGQPISGPRPAGQLFQTAEPDPIVAAPGESDALHFSGVRDLRVLVADVSGGVEDIADFNNRCANVELSIIRGRPRGRYCFTVKGESDRISISALLEGHGSETDTDLGNWSDQASGRTHIVALNVTHHDASKHRVRVLNAWAPVLQGGGPYQVDTRAKGWFAIVWGVLKKFFNV